MPSGTLVTRRASASVISLPLGRAGGDQEDPGHAVGDGVDRQRAPVRGERRIERALVGVGVGEVGELARVAAVGVGQPDLRRGVLSSPSKSKRWNASVRPSGEWSENSLNVKKPKFVTWKRPEPSGLTLNRSARNWSSSVSRKRLKLILPLKPGNVAQAGAATVSDDERGGDHHVPPAEPHGEPPCRMRRLPQR